MQKWAEMMVWGQEREEREGSEFRKERREGKGEAVVRFEGQIPRPCRCSADVDGRVGGLLAECERCEGCESPTSRRGGRVEVR